MTWVQRVQDERAELAEKLTRLEITLESPGEQIDDDQLQLLRVQHSVMKAYLTVLDARLICALEKR